MSHSLKRGSLFYVRNTSTNPQPSLRSIYRQYIKSGLLVYRKCNMHIGCYLFKLLYQKKTYLENQHKRFAELKEFIQQLQQNKIDPAKTNKRMFKKFTSKQPEQTLIRLHNHYSLMQRIITQKMLYNFQSIYHISLFTTQGLNPNTLIDLRSAQLSKLVYLAFNISQFFTPTLLPRTKYQSLIALDYLEEDMEFEILNDKDKDYVRDVLVKVCGTRKNNHTKFRTVNDYLKDPNAVVFEAKSKKVQLGNSKKFLTEKQKAHSKQSQESVGNTQNLTDSEADLKSEQRSLEQEQEKQQSDEWSLLNQRDRDRAVKAILMNHNGTFEQQQDRTENTPSEQLLPRTLLFEVMQNLNLIESLFNPSAKTPDELYQVCRRLFKLKSSPLGQSESVHSGENANQQWLKIPLLEDAIIDYPFIDEFINMKKIIVV